VGACLVLLSMSLAVGRTASDSHMARQVSGIGDLRLKVGEPFLHARSRIIRLGWKPVPMHRDDNYEYSGAEKRLAERSIREVDSCSIDAGANCILYYQKKAECLRVDTVGEQVNEMKITRWTNECPPAKS
jgi:hypothetical protein